jgi:hypothetical protein
VIQFLASGHLKLGSLKGAYETAFGQEAVMSEVSVFRQYAEEAMRDSKVAGEAEKRDLEELACTWAQAALMGDRVFGSSWSPDERSASNDQKKEAR